MKTTLEIPDDVFIAAKKRAADERRSLRDFVISGLRAELRRRRRAPAPARIRWVTVAGELPAGIDLSDRDAMYDLRLVQPLH